MPGLLATGCWLWDASNKRGTVREGLWILRYKSSLIPPSDLLAENTLMPTEARAADRSSVCASSTHAAAVFGSFSIRLPT